MAQSKVRYTEKIKLWGIVQGVGFRPFVAKCADKYGMKGEVLNIGGLVDIVVTDTKEKIDTFVEAVKREKPAPAEIVHIKREVLGISDASDPAESKGFREFEKFSILDSDEGDDEAAMIPSDLSMCPDCMREIMDPEDPRYLHPFISCMVCGPRYTVIDRIPYDRDNTAMIDWPMCGFCNGEYTERTDRRYHAQTISCHDCGPVLLFELYIKEKGFVRQNGGECTFLSAQEISEACETAFGDKKYDRARFQNRDEHIKNNVLIPLACAKKIIENGGVIAVKGVGGYNLVCDPADSQAVAKLRTIKKREKKPFAVMFRDIAQIRRYCNTNETEENLLSSSARPIMLLEHREMDKLEEAVKNDTKGKGTAEEYAGSRFIGSFLPSMGVQYLLLAACGRPLIVTSANPSDMPIIKDDEEIKKFTEDRKGLVSGLLYNERDIRVRVDDSVVREIDGQPQVIRRSKGYAPVPLFISRGDMEKDGKPVSVFAAGGQLKNSFALSKGRFSYISQYFGDLDSAENRKIYEENTERLKDLFRIEPQAVCCDMHPLYFTTGFAERYAEEHGLPLFKVQHHHAHVASVMAEHDINDTVIGVSMDGTGYGTDKNIWGGEFLVCRGAHFERAAHLKYIKMIGGDGSMKEAWKSAMCYELDHEEEKEDIKSPFIRVKDDNSGSAQLSVCLEEIFRFSDENSTIKARPERDIVRAAVKNGINVISSSSMGRLFDAVSALLGIKDHNDYEGQCAIMLEDAAHEAEKHPGVSERDDLALLFHERVAEMISRTCKDIREGVLPSAPSGRGVDKVALTGGVFQNKILMEKTLKLLRADGFDVYYNISVSPNDGGIPLGQNYLALALIEEQEEHAQ